MGVSVDQTKKSGVKLTLKEEAAMDLADEFRGAILRRTGLKRDELSCPREKSDMTPCVARDGGLAVSFAGHSSTPQCVGCCWGLNALVEKEQSSTPNVGAQENDKGEG